MKFAWIHTEKAAYPVSKLCRWLGVTPSGYYAWRTRPESAHARRDRQLKVLIRASFEAHKHRCGSPRIYGDLQEAKEPVSRKRVVRLMLEDALKARPRKRFKCTTMPVPPWLVLVHLAFMAWTVFNAHYPALFLGGFPIRLE